MSAGRGAGRFPPSRGKRVEERFELRDPKSPYVGGYWRGRRGTASGAFVCPEGAARYFPATRGARAVVLRASSCKFEGARLVSLSPSTGDDHDRIVAVGGAMPPRVEVSRGLHRLLLRASHAFRTWVRIDPAPARGRKS